MSLVFNDITTYKGIVQIYEKEIGANRGDVSGNADFLKEFTADCNLAFDDFLSLAFSASGSWQLDDSNHTDYPIITANLVSGQRDYTFTTDGSSNLILDIYRVMVKDSNGVFHEIYPVDQQTPNNDNINTDSFIDGQNATGTPSRYDKTGNGIFLDLIPNYSSSGGLKIFINREASYFVSTDTTKKPGVPGNLHKWFALRPAQDYARRHSLTCLPRLEIEVAKMEKTIQDTFGGRERDISRRLVPLRQNNR